MKFLILIIIVGLSANVLAARPKSKKKIMHDKEHHHVKKKSLADHSHDPAHHKKHDHSKHHPSHDTDIVKEADLHKGH